MESSTSDFPVLHHLPELAETHVHRVGDAINLLILCRLLLFLPSIFPSIRGFSNELTLCMRLPKYWSSASASVLPMNSQSWFPLGLTVWSPCSPRDFQESSPTPQFKSINFLALRFLYGPTFSFILDYWKSHRFDYKDLCWQSDVSAF